MSLSPNQLRLLSSIGVGILVGTSLIVIIPEGIEAVASSGAETHAHKTRSIIGSRHAIGSWEASRLAEPAVVVHEALTERMNIHSEDRALNDVRVPVIRIGVRAPREEEDQQKEAPSELPADQPSKEKVDEHQDFPTFYIGFALMAGFVLMFLIDRLPRHATESFQPASTTRHVSLDDLSAPGGAGEEETDGFLGSLAPSPKQSRSLATTTGLVIHAAADGIAMGASATTEDMKLRLIIFIAIMIHKAPAAFGLTSVLLKQGLSKRAARGHLIIFSLAAPAGALGTYLLISLLGGAHMEGEKGKWWTGMLLLFSAGTFL